jgi:hypothetical protein
VKLMHVIAMVLSLIYCGVVFSQSQSSESALKPCRSQPHLVGTGLKVAWT